LIGAQPANLDAISGKLILVVALGGVTQILGTWALLKTFAHRNFAVGSAFSKTEALQAAVYGSVFLAIPLSGASWLAVIIGVIGVVFLMLPRQENVNRLRWSASLSPASGYGLLSGASFAVSTLCVFEANQMSALAPAAAAATTLIIMTPIQVLVVTVWLALTEPHEFTHIRRLWRSGLFIGICGALGSIGWFTAMSYQSPGVVRTLGQIEFLFTLAITHFFFGEAIFRREWIGILIILASALLLVVGI